MIVLTVNDVKLVFFLFPRKQHFIFYMICWLYGYSTTSLNSI